MANVLLLQKALEKGVEAVIVNENNRIRLLGKRYRRITLKKDMYKYVSLLPMTPTVTNISTVGMKYNIDKYDMHIDKEISLGVSNEILASTGEISIEDGILIVIEAKD
jgi:thiamine pyrophosphokinase